MKKYLNIAFVLLAAVLLTSCLKSGLRDLDTYSGNDITGIVGVYHRYYSTDKIPASGEYAVRQTALNVSNTHIDEEAATCEFDVSIPTNFPADEDVSNVSAATMVVVLNISTAAVIKPLNGAPALGAPGDWSRPNQYRITAANGDKKTWTITLNF